MDFTTDYRMLIDGKMVAGAGEIDVVNPATGEKIATAPDCSAAQLEDAVAAARRAFPGWKATPIAQRSALLKAAAGVFMENADALMRVLTSEQGKPHNDAIGEMMGSAYWLATVADMSLPVTTTEDTPERLSETRRVPLGVVGAISPWNFPVILSVWKIAPALLAGNTMVLKPSPFTPLAVLKVGELLAGVFPPGVLNIVTGGDALGPMITSHPGIDKISFTGSSATGRRVMESASKDLKRLTLELGGNDAAIVMPDVDVQKVAKELFWAAFKNTGQICVATKRMFIHSAIYDELAAAMTAYAATVQVGDGAMQGTELGPVQNKPQFERVKSLLDDCRANGFRFLVGGEVDSDGQGYFIPVTIVDNPPDSSRIVKEEPFGPILPLLKFDDIDEVVARANDSEYGLAGSVWSKDTDQARAIAERLDTGTVWINEVQHLTPFAQFAGHKQSGFGVENGEEGLLEYTAPQTITLKRG